MSTSSTSNRTPFKFNISSAALKPLPRAEGAYTAFLANRGLSTPKGSPSKNDFSAPHDEGAPCSPDATQGLGGDLGQAAVRRAGSKRDGPATGHEVKSPRSPVA